jgi:hypothetical protein
MPATECPAIGSRRAAASLDRGSPGSLIPGLNDLKFNPALFLRLAAGNGSALILRWRALRCEHIAPAPG